MLHMLARRNHKQIKGAKRFVAKIKKRQKERTWHNYLYFHKVPVQHNIAPKNKQ